MTGIDAPDQIKLVEETFDVSTREVERGRIVVRTRVDEREEIAEAVISSDEVEVERVLVNQEVHSAPPVREEDGVLIIPVLAEEIVVRTRLVLKEEIRIVRRSRQETFRQPVRLRSEHAEVVRVPERDLDQPNPEGHRE